MSFENISFRGEAEEAGFQEVLARLKVEGCNLLLTGEVPGEVADVASRRLLGAPSEDRKRLLVFTDASVDRVPARLPGGVGPTDPDVRVVEQAECTRSAAASLTDAGPGIDAAAPPFPVRSVGEDLAELRTAIGDAVSEFDEATGGLEPAQFRLSVDSVRLLLDEHPPDAVSKFLRTVTALVKGVRGMAHYHLPVPDESGPVASVTSLFDARIELRQRDGMIPEQRWHVPARGQRTNWVRL